MSGKSDDEPFEELARHLRQQAGGEFRAEAEAAERETEQGRRRRRRLDEVARQSLERGGWVMVETVGWSVSGRVTAVGRDYFTVEDEERECDVLLERVIWRRQRSPRGGSSGVPGSLTFKARLAEYELSGEELTVVAPSIGLSLEGRIMVAATDHLLVVDDLGGEWVVPVGAVTMVTRTLPRRH